MFPKHTRRRHNAKSCCCCCPSALHFLNAFSPGAVSCAVARGDFSRFDDKQTRRAIMIRKIRDAPVCRLRNEVDCLKEIAASRPRNDTSDDLGGFYFRRKMISFKWQFGNKAQKISGHLASCMDLNFLCFTMDSPWMEPLKLFFVAVRTSDKIAAHIEMSVIKFISTWSLNSYKDWVGVGASRKLRIVYRWFLSYW